MDQPLHVQYITYLKNVLRGDFGTSWYTSNPVQVDIMQRLPATLELISFGMAVALIIGVPLGIITAYYGKKGIANTASFIYGMLAGAIPDFWFGLIVIYFLYFKLRWVPAPLGRLGVAVPPPHRITGMYIIDSLVTFNWPALRSAVSHIALPIVTLVFVYMGPIVKMTRETMAGVLGSNFIDFARANGLPTRTVIRHALRNSLPPVVTIVGTLYGVLLGGAVLIETVFSWGGMGQYAVQSINVADFAPIQAFVVIAAVFNLIIYKNKFRKTSAR